MRALHPRLLRAAHVVLQAALLAAPLASTGCVGTQQGAVNAAGLEGPVRPVDVPDVQYAQDLHRVLRDGKQSPERLGLLVGVVRRQLAHAAQRFGSGHDARGTESVVGALYLVRTGEGRAEMVDTAGGKALAGAAERVSARGDEGRAEAFMRMRAAALDPASPDRRVIEDHLAALAQWKKDTRSGGGPMRQLGLDERSTVSRALVDPSEAAQKEAVAAVSAWISRAIEYQESISRTHERLTREEAVEVERALDSGSATMAILFLRNGDARGAVEALFKSDAVRTTVPAFGRAIE